jgi:electron transfer flavoprotein beta subunit
MNIIVAIKHIPSLTDELPTNKAGTNLDFDDVDFVLNEFDEHAIEQAVLVKEASGGTVTVLGIDPIEELDNVLHTALAKGADSAAKITGLEPGLDSHTHARLLADQIRGMSPHLVFTGVQAADDIDGQIGPMLAAYLDMPYVGVVNGVQVNGGKVSIHKEYSGGVMAEFEVDLPAVIGIQAAAQPPRYAPISKIRQMAQTVKITEIELDDPGDGSGTVLRKMAEPVSAGHAEMLEGDAKTVAKKIAALLEEKGLL